MHIAETGKNSISSMIEFLTDTKNGKNITRTGQ